MNTKACKTRFAPSPTGLMHLGNLRVALFNILYAKHQQGIFLLRIEDTDAVRSELRFNEDILKDLQWLSLFWQEGPFYQSERQNLYDHYYEILQEKGLIYPCFCSDAELAINRKVQMSKGQPPRYPGTCRHLDEAAIAAKKAQGLPYTLRFTVPKNKVTEFEDLIKGPQRFVNDHIGDFIIRRADGTAPFMYSNALDDALLGITHALRGDDHLTNTPRQIMLLQALNLPVPQYGHFPTILGPDSKRLSKRNGSRSVQELREIGYHPLAIINYLARLGHNDEKMSLDDLETLAKRFDVSRIGRSPAHYDESQLNFWQKEAISHCSSENCWDLIAPYVESIVPVEKREMFVKTIQSNILFPVESKKWAEIIFTDPLAFSEDASAVIKTTGEAFFRQAEQLFNTSTDFQSFTTLLQKETGLKGKSFFMPLRAALIGDIYGPELVKVWELLGKEKIVLRLRMAQQHAANL